MENPEWAIKGPRRILPCPGCSANKKPSTHTYGTYRVYISGTTITLICKSCRKEQKFRFIRGGVE